MPNLAVPHSHFNDPFDSTRRHYYLTPELSQRVNLIRHLIQNSEQLLLVLAEAGYGKTALLNQLKKIAEKQCEHWWIYTPLSSPALSPEAFISGVLATLNVRQDGKPLQTLIESLRNHLAATRYNGQLPVLLVDDAHKLPLATLKFIVELAMQGEPLTRMRVLLFCEPQITSILATPEFEMVHNTLIHTLDVPPFSKTQVRDYLQFCLKGSKYHNIHPFNSEVIKTISTNSEGIPGKINRYAQQVLHQFVEQRQEQTLPSTLSASKLLWGFPIVLVLIGIALLIYWNSPTPQKISPAQPIEGSVSLPSASLYDTTSTNSATTGSQSDNKSNSTLLEQTNNTAFSTNFHQDTNRTDLFVQQQIKGKTWLLRQKPNAYTLQILGVHDRLTLNKFLTQHPLNEIAMYKTTFQNKDWYVVLYGIYPNRSQAEEARKTLPTSLRETQPWIRSLASVHNSINQ